MARPIVLIPHLFRLAGVIIFRKDYSPPSSPPSRPFNPVQQIGGPQRVANMPIGGDRVPQRHVEAYQDVPPVEIQLVHRQEADSV